MKKTAWIAAALLASFSAIAAQHQGVEVYPGAKPEEGVAQFLAKKMSLKNAGAFRTSDPVAKVAEFYRKQKLEELPGTSKEGAAFSGKGSMVTIQNPWMDMATGQIKNDTLISIVKQ